MTQTDREKLAAEHPDAWIPVSAGEVLDGEVTDIDIGYSEVSGHNYPILTVTDGSGVEVKVFCFATALHNEVYRKQPIPGERILLTYHGTGEAKIKGQSPPEIYRLRIAGRTPESYRRVYESLQPRGAAADVARSQLSQLPPPLEHAGALDA